ncbi:MAG TPA: DUF1772 domain-containing protein [Streptosporangiaceae bacterium]|jgi:hypothetical protein
MTVTLAVIVLVTSGTAAGVLFSVALSVVPAFQALPPDRYVELHKLIGRRYDHVMPPTVAIAVAADVVLAVIAPGAAAPVLFGCAAAAGAGVMVVSQFGNVPINRRVKRLAPGAVPDGWPDPRPRWRALHLARTSFALAALVINACAVLAAR